MATVLIADDDAHTRLLVRSILTHAGHSVFEAHDGAAALAQARAGRPSLILLDLSMAGMSGPDFLRALRADEQLKHTAVALYTATPMNAAIRDFAEMYSIVDVIAKPSEPGEFLAAVERALNSA
jgi:two-component system, chemotaxis family, chemotaxis protein CheY